MATEVRVVKDVVVVVVSLEESKMEMAVFARKPIKRIIKQIAGRRKLRVFLLCLLLLLLLLLLLFIRLRHGYPYPYLYPCPYPHPHPYEYLHGYGVYFPPKEEPELPKAMKT